jgi:hypothetical protein
MVVVVEIIDIIYIIYAGEKKARACMGIWLRKAIDWLA